MGLSASQARLLSITQRINNNELQSEFIANAKMQLAARNTLASEKYINALDDTKLEYISYNDTGIKENVALTFNALNQYTPLKNQYAMFNNENQIYVSQADAANFQKSNDLYEFLDKYGLFDQGRDEHTVAYNNWEKDHNKWLEEKDEYDTAWDEFKNKRSDEWQTYLTAKEEYDNAQRAAYESSPEYQAYLAATTAFASTGGLYNTFIGIVNGNFHYGQAQSGDPGCFLHVLDNLLYKSTPCDTTVAGKKLTSLWETSTYNEPSLHSVADIMSDPTLGKFCVCDGIDVGTNGSQNLYEQAIANGQPITDLIRLASDYKEVVDTATGDVSYELKTLNEKTIDMYYLILNSTDMRSGAGSLNLWALSDIGVTVQDFLVDYVDGDMRQLDPEAPPYNPTPYPNPEPTFEHSLRPEPQRPVETDKIYDKPLAQWYTNLWNLMDGTTDSDEIYSVYDDQAEFSYFTVGNKPKESTLSNNHYVVIPDDIASDPQWFQFAINNGQVTLSQAALRNNTNCSDITWQRVELSSTSDIYETQDSTKIAKAEAEYKQTLYEIQAEDKQFDIKIKKLDTEHSALLKEVESIKGVMDKNTERSYSAFS